MRINKKPLIIAGMLAVVGLSGIAGLRTASAESSYSKAGVSGLVDKLASKFNLNKDEVQAVFDQDRADHEAEQKTRVESELNQAVSDGKITSEQKDKILAKAEEIRAQRQAKTDSNTGKPNADNMKVGMKVKRAELKKWASDNNIPKEYLRYVIGHGGPGRGHPSRMP